MFSNVDDEGGSQLKVMNVSILAGHPETTYIQ